MKTILPILLIAVLLTACGPSQQEIQSTVQTQVAISMLQTQVAAPTATMPPTATPEPVKLEDLLQDDNYLPDGVEYGNFSTTLPDGFPAAPADGDYVVRGIKDGKFVGEGIFLMRYTDQAEREAIYDNITSYIEGDKGETKDQVEGWFGEKGLMRRMSASLGIPKYSAVFTRCEYIVYINAFGYNAHEMLDYTKQLDKELESYCIDR